MTVPTGPVTFLFTDIEGSSRLWEEQPERMQPALARHDAVMRDVVANHGGMIVKMLGDGVHAAFNDPVEAIGATIDAQLALASPPRDGLALRARCGLHAGIVEQREGDFFGSSVNRAARIMSVAHGGQVLLSRAVADLVSDRLPPNVSLHDLGNVRLRDLAKPEQVFQVVHPQLRRDFPALRSLESTPNNLPQQLSSFIGRERELAELKTLLAKSPLLTLCGAGGIGKTRLALQLAADRLVEYPDGVWLVELAPLTDAHVVPQAVATVVGVKEEVGRPVTEALVKYVADLRMLLILDNCEHLVGACAELAEHLLRSGKSLRIIASSRERLNVPGESIFPVPALAIPTSQSLDTKTIGKFEAVRLFIERAASSSSSFELTPANAAAVVSICRQLDGIPLALELAAARTRALSVENIAARLSDRFKLLTTGSRTALPRQQTLRALIDWSYDFLAEDERALCRRLAVFAGGWTLDAAEATCAGSGLTRDSIVDLLSALVEKSLVTLDRNGQRYGLLETVRQYAQERLAESGEADALRSRHLAFYLALAEEARAAMGGPQQREWLMRLDAERENLLAAHAWCESAAEGAAIGLRLVHALKPYWITRGALGMGHRVTVDALARGDTHERSLARCRALFDAGQLCYFMGRYTEARQRLEDSLSIARELRDDAMVARILQPLGSALLGNGDTAGARGHLEEALVLCTAIGDKRQVAAASNQLAQLYRVDARLDEAERLYERVLMLTREIEDRDFTAIALLNLAMVSIDRGRTTQAQSQLSEALAIVREIGSRAQGQSVLEVCAGLEASRGQFERAAQLFGIVEVEAAQTGLHRDPADEAFFAPWIARARAALGDAGFAQASASGAQVGYDAAIEQVQRWLS